MTTTSISNRVADRVIGSIPGHASNLVVSLAEDVEVIRASQRLRYKVFAEEQGAALHTLEAGLDVDAYDRYCHHIVVHDRMSNDVVASTRVLLNEDARLAGGFYSESEFELGSLLASSGPMMEIGRTCVHSAYRSGVAISLLWAGLARFIDLGSYQYMIGCASIPMPDRGVAAHGIYSMLKEKYLLPVEQRAVPRLPLPPVPSVTVSDIQLPPLLKAYIRLGARIGGEPCWDPAFQCADLLIVLSPGQIARKYARHFMVGESQHRKAS